jgi:hypothetical protein
MLRWFVGLTISACAVGCGGNVVVDHGAGGAGGATTSMMSSSNAIGPEGAAPASSSSTAMTCPGEVDEDGACPIEGQACPMDRTCCGGGAVCTGGKWRFTGVFCHMPCGTSCGPDDGLACEVGSLCVAVQSGKASYTYHCAADPCPPDANDCSCAGSLCPAGLACSATTEAPFVVCDCTDC